MTMSRSLRTGRAWSQRAELKGAAEDRKACGGMGVWCAPVAPVRVLAANVLLEDRSKCWLVLCDEARPLLEHEAHRSYQQRRVAHGHPQLFAHFQTDELGQTSRAQIDESHIRRQVARRRERLVEDEPVYQVLGALSRRHKVREPRRQLVDPRYQHRYPEARVVLAARSRRILLVIQGIILMMFMMTGDGR